MEKIHARAAMYDEAADHIASVFDELETPVEKEQAEIVSAHIRKIGDRWFAKVMSIKRN